MNHASIEIGHGPASEGYIPDLKGGWIWWYSVKTIERSNSPSKNRRDYIHVYFRIQDDIYLFFGHELCPLLTTPKKTHISNLVQMTLALLI